MPRPLPTGATIPEFDIAVLKTMGVDCVFTPDMDNRRIIRPADLLLPTTDTAQGQTC